MNGEVEERVASDGGNGQVGIGLPGRMVAHVRVGDRKALAFEVCKPATAWHGHGVFGHHAKVTER